jgi:membrane protein implicated in regulation of membrane protease activity
VPWFIWLVIAVLALAGETVSTAFVLVYVGVAAAITAVFAALGLPLVFQLVVFIPLTLALLTMVRPRSLALLHGRGGQHQISAHTAMIDRMGMAESDISESMGMVRLGSGEFWTARAYPPGAVIAKGSKVRVMFVDGLTAHVSQSVSGDGSDDLRDAGANLPGE